MSAQYRREGEGSNLSDVRSHQEREEGVVEQFSYQRGYGFIRPDNGEGDIFINIPVVQQSGIRRFVAGIRVSYRLEEIDPGQFRAFDIRLAKKKPKTEEMCARPSEAHHLDKNSKETRTKYPNPHQWINGVIKWFDPNKGYGFVQFSNNLRDAYLSKRVLDGLQMNIKKSFEGLAVKVQLMPGKKPNSIEVAAIVFIQPLSIR